MSKKYRPFANAEEFAQHRDKWIDRNGSPGFCRVCAFDDEDVWIGDKRSTYEQLFQLHKFDDGTPCGVEVVEDMNWQPATPADVVNVPRARFRYSSYTDWLYGELSGCNVVQGELRYIRKGDAESYGVCEVFV